MASVIIGIVGSALVNALAFTGGGYLFKHLDKNNSLLEQKRHNIALEKYNKSMEEYREKRQNYMDYINKQLHLQNISHRDFQNVDEAMDLYNSFTNNEKIHIYKPNLLDYYKPSNEQKKYELIFVLSGTIIVIFLVYKFS